MLTIILLIFDLICLGAALYFMIESFHEKEPRAPYVGLAGVLFHVILIPLIIWIPVLKVPITILFCIYLLSFLLCLIPGKPNPRALMGSTGYKVEDVKLFDERDTVFARVEGLQQHPELKQFEEYYNHHPEFKAYDEKRKDGGFPVGPPGTIDDYYPPTKAMVEANWHMCEIMGNHFNAVGPIPIGGRYLLALMNLGMSFPSLYPMRLYSPLRWDMNMSALHRTRLRWRRA
jgi:hypothetical protein